MDTKSVLPPEKEDTGFEQEIFLIIMEGENYDTSRTAQQNSVDLVAEYT